MYSHMAPIKEVVSYCDHLHNMYYDKQGEFCKRCDKCFPGLGLVSITERKFDIDPVHGALGCRHCIRCPKGFYSDSLSFDRCLPCKDCRAVGRSETQMCTPKQNAICGEIKPLKPGSNSHTTIVSISVGSFVVLVVALAVIIYKCLNNQRRQENYHEDSSNSDSDKSLMSTEVSSLSYSKSTLETDGPTDSVEDVNSVVKEFKQKYDQRMEFTEIDASMISKSIAANSRFYKIGIHLGILDDDIQIIIANNKDVESQAYKTLIKWRQLKASEATVLTFIDTIVLLDLYDVALKFCNLHNQRTLNMAS